MKKLFVLALAATLLLSFAGCAKQSSGEFDYIVRLLEEEDYEGAKEEIDKLLEEAEEDDDDDREEVTVPATVPDDMPVGEPGAAATGPAAESPAEMPVETEPQPTKAAETRKLLEKLSITTVDNLGNTNTNDHRNTYTYDNRGRVIRVFGQEMAASYGFYLHTIADYLTVNYASDGTVENFKVTDHSGTSVSALGTPTYDESGNMISMLVATNTEEFTLNFSYNADGKLIRADIFDTFWQEISFDLQYTYDENGNLVKEVWDMVGFGNTGKTVEYTYDENGRLIQSVTQWDTYEPWYETTEYSYDEDGDIKQSVTTTDSKEAGYKTKTVNYIYTYIPV